MPKYKISKSNLKEFFGLFGRSKEDRQAKINQLIDNDPVLKKLDKEIADINKKATERMKTYDPDWIELLRKQGVNIK
jgi:hypothetical protein